MNSNESLPATAYSRFAYLGIDNGFTGAIACLLPDNRVFARPVKFIDLGQLTHINRPVIECPLKPPSRCSHTRANASCDCPT